MHAHGVESEISLHTGTKLSNETEKLNFYEVDAEVSVIDKSFNKYRIVIKWRRAKALRNVKMHDEAFTARVLDISSLATGHCRKTQGECVYLQLHSQARLLGSGIYNFPNTPHHRH